MCPQSFDRNQDGVLQKLEFEEFMSQLGVFLARQELRVVFDNFDQNKDGNIAYSEFVNVLKVSVLTFKSCAGLLSFLVNLKPLIYSNLSIQNSRQSYLYIAVERFLILHWEVCRHRQV